MEDLAATLRRHGITPSAQRIAVARYVLATDEHPTADRVWERVRGALPVLSRATVYNSLHAFVERGLLREVLADGRVRYDPVTEPHHHFVDEATGTVHDVPWEALRVAGLDGLRGCEVRSYQVVLRGRRRGATRTRR